MSTAGTRAALLGFALLGGCTVGPHYVRPRVTVPSAYKESAPPAYRNADAGTWQPASPQDGQLKGRWWRVFGQPEFDMLEAQLDINNQTIAEYFQSFMAARAQISEARAAYFPTVTVEPSVSREHLPSALGGGAAGSASPGGTVITLPVDASWEPDLWGRVRNTLREYRYGAQISAADLQNERLSEQAALAEYYFELRGQDALQELYDRTVQADRQTLQITRGLFDTGVDDAEAVAQARVTLADAQAAAAGLAANRALYEHAIATLIGRPASSFSMPVKPLTTRVPPIPVGIPSQLLQRRPDVAAAERTMAQANALIGIATAAYYPTLDLTGSTGFESTRLSKLLSAPAWFWSLGASAAETVFDAGLRRASVAQYRASFNADVATYRQTILSAFQQVEDAIATLRVVSTQLTRQNDAVQAAQQYLDIALTRYQTGVDPYLNVMTAQTTLLADQQAAMSERTAELSAAVQLVQALGGGWDVSQLPGPSAIGQPATAAQLAPGSSRVILTGQ